MFALLCLFALLSTGTAFFNPTKDPVKLSPENLTRIRGAIQNCAEKNGLPSNIIELVRAGKNEENDVFKTFIHCCYQADGTNDSDGRIIPTKLADLFPKELNLLPYFESCDKPGPDPVETTFAAYKCTQETLPVRVVSE